MPSSPLDKFDSLDKELSLLSKEEDKVATLLSYIQLNPSSIGFDLPSMRHFVSNSSSFSSHARVGTNVDTHSTFLDQLSALCKKYGLERQYPTVLLNALMQVTSSIANPSRGPIPIKRNPCANGIPALSKSCPNEGNLACAACRIVSYCSKVRLHTYIPSVETDTIVVGVPESALEDAQEWYVCRFNQLPCFFLFYLFFILLTFCL